MKVSAKHNAGATDIPTYVIEDWHEDFALALVAKAFAEARALGRVPVLRIRGSVIRLEFRRQPRKGKMLT